jgi:formylglycine-generating enzyme required for sulfatase activity
MNKFGSLVFLAAIAWALAPLVRGEEKMPAPPAGSFVQKIPDSPFFFVMVPIKGGKYTTSPTGPDGKPLAAKEVEIKPYFMAQTEMTWDIFDIWALSRDAAPKERRDNANIPRDKSDTRSRPSDALGAPDHGFGHEGYAAISLTYKNARECCQWLAKKTGRPYRLPTEAEWEYAATCGGAIPARPMEAAALSKIAWYHDNSEDSTHAVGKLAPNAWGLHDTLGNVGEWCLALEGKTQVLRGGGYRTQIQSLHPGTRQIEIKAWRGNEGQDPPSPWWYSEGRSVGFRVVMDLVEEKK